MNDIEVKAGTHPREYIAWILVTIPLLAIGAVLWVLGLIFRFVQLFRNRRIDD